MFTTSLLKRSSLLAFAAASILFTACDPNKNEVTYTVPDTYNFSNVNYAGQTDRLTMLAELSAEMKKGNTAGTRVSAEKLKNMYRNTNNPFSFTSTRQLKDKTFEPDRARFEAHMDALAEASNSVLPGRSGVAGVVTSNDGTKSYLFDANGVELTQIIEKGLMGAIFYYQATSVYLNDSKIGPNVDNTIAKEGQGTDMEHHWDEAFGYYGVPVDFPTNLTGIRFFGKYGNDRNALVKTNDIMKNGFIKGRAAISAKDMDGKVAARDVVRTEWEKVVAATAIHYLNKGKANIADDALRNHELSEAIAFIGSLKYNERKKITDAQITSILNEIGTNLYQVTPERITSARNTLAGIYGMDAIKEQL